MFLTPIAIRSTNCSLTFAIRIFAVNFRSFFLCWDFFFLFLNFLNYFFMLWLFFFMFRKLWDN